MATSAFDRIYRRAIIAKYFTCGWGDAELLRRIYNFRKSVASDPDKWRNLVSPNHKVTIDKTTSYGQYTISQGHFTSPLLDYLTSVMSKEVATARFEAILPSTWKTTKMPVCIHLAGTGDHFFWRRRHLMALPLIKEYGIGSILLENPYSSVDGARKPKEQTRSSLKHVIDIFIMGLALVLESSVLLHWCQSKGYGPLCLHGISMGGHMASLAATAWPDPIALAPCLSWSTASVVFTEGVMSRSCNWSQMQKQYDDSRLDDQPILYNDLKEIQEVRRLSPFTYQTNAKSSESKIRFINDLDPGVMHAELVDISDIEHAGMSEDQLQLLEEKHINSKDLQQKQTSLVMPFGWIYKGKNVLKKSPEVDRDKRHIMEIARYVFDEFTHMQQFPCPVDTSSIVIVTAEKDAYIPRDHVIGLDKIWPGCEIRYLVGCGHVDAFLTKLHLFRKAIADSMDKVQACH